MTNANGSINAARTNGAVRINTGKAEYTLEANLAAAKRTVKIGQVAVLPNGGEWMRVDSRKDADGASWVVIQ